MAVCLDPSLPSEATLEGGLHARSDIPVRNQTAINKFSISHLLNIIALSFDVWRHVTRSLKFTLSHVTLCGLGLKHCTVNSDPCFWIKRCHVCVMCRLLNQDEDRLVWNVHGFQGVLLDLACFPIPYTGSKIFQQLAYFQHFEQFCFFHYHVIY